MSKMNLNRKNWLKKKTRTKKSLGVLGKYFRLVIFKSNRHIYGQLIDDNKNETLLSCSTKDKIVAKNVKDSNTKVQNSKEIGYVLAEKIKDKKIKKIIFDRNGYRFHGRVKAVADGIKEKGISI